MQVVQMSTQNMPTCSESTWRRSAMDGNAFTGTIRSVTIEVGQDDESYKLDPEGVFNGLMAMQ